MRGLTAVEWICLKERAIEVGDVVSADAGGMPIYRVAAVVDGQVWLRDDEHAEDQVMPLACLHWKAART
jgi:hypothetical protein